MYNKFPTVPFALYLVAGKWTYNENELLSIPLKLHLFRTRGETLFRRLLRDASVSDISWNLWNVSTNDICIFASNLSKQNARTSGTQERKRPKFPNKFSRNACKSEYLIIQIIWTIFAISLDETLLVDRLVNEIKRKHLQDWRDRRSEVRETQRNG